VVVANVDPVCWSIWLEWMTFWAGSGTDFEENGEANAADGHSLDVAGREKIGIILWGILFPGFEVRVMRTLPSRMLLGREFILRHNMELDLGVSLEVSRWRPNMVELGSTEAYGINSERWARGGASRKFMSLLRRWAKTTSEM
jgi:hypothetical protein